MCDISEQDLLVLQAVSMSVGRRKSILSESLDTYMRYNESYEV